MEFIPSELGNHYKASGKAETLEWSNDCMLGEAAAAGARAEAGTNWTFLLRGSTQEEATVALLESG